MNGVIGTFFAMTSGAAIACGVSAVAGGTSRVGSPAAVRADYAASAILNPSGLSASANPGKIHRAADGFFYVQAELNGVPVRFLVDTGASVAVLTRSDARRVGAKIISSEAASEIGTVGGRVPMSWTNLKQLNLGPHHIRNVRAAIVSDDLSVSLIGQNVLAQLSSLRIDGDDMRLE